MIKAFLTGIFLVISSFVSIAQTTGIGHKIIGKDLENLFFVPHTHNNQWTKNTSNEIEWLLSGFFLAYKNFFSSQDGNSCTFIPSCSEFALQQIRLNGPFIGIPATFDRLTRCNGLSPENYKTDLKTGLLMDPVFD